MDFLPGYVTDHDLSLPASGEAETTSNEIPETLLENQLDGNNGSNENNEIAKTTAVYIVQ